MASEDFGWFLSEKPGAFLWIGNGPGDGRPRPAQPDLRFQRRHPPGRCDLPGGNRAAGVGGCASQRPSTPPGRARASPQTPARRGPVAPGATRRCATSSRHDDTRQAAPAVDRSNPSRSAGRERAGLIGLVAVGLAVGQAWCAATLLAAALATAGLTAGSGLARQARTSPWCSQFSHWAGPGVTGPSAWRSRRVRRPASGCAPMPWSGCSPPGQRCSRRAASGQLAATVVDRIEALDGLLRALAAGRPAGRRGTAAGRSGRAVGRSPGRGLILLGCGLLVPFGMALSGIGAAAASRRQFAAMARLQARFLDRVRGIATIVLHGRAADEAAALGRAADELRRRTMRVLRVAFLSSAALDCAAALALVAIALHDGLCSAAAACRTRRRAVRPAAGARVLRAAAGVLGRVPGPASRRAARPRRLPACLSPRSRLPAPPDPHRVGPRRRHLVRGCRLHLGPGPRAGAGRPDRSACRPARRSSWPARRGPASRR